MEETEEDQQAWLISKHDSKVRVILRVKQRKQIGLFLVGSHPGLPQGPDEKENGHLLLSALIHGTAMAS